MNTVPSHPFLIASRENNEGTRSRSNPTRPAKRSHRCHAFPPDISITGGHERSGTEPLEDVNRQRRTSLMLQTIFEEQRLPILHLHRLITSQRVKQKTHIGISEVSHCISAIFSLAAERGIPSNSPIAKERPLKKVLPQATQHLLDLHHFRPESWLVRSRKSCMMRACLLRLRVLVVKCESFRCRYGSCASASASRCSCSVVSIRSSLFLASLDGMGISYRMVLPVLKRIH